MHRPTSVPCFWSLRTLLQIRPRLLIHRIARDASRPADLRRLRRDLNGVGIVAARLARRPRATATAVLVSRDDLPRRHRSHTAGVASLGTIHPGNGHCR